MPARRLLMRKIREILRLRHEQGLSHEAVAQACAVGVGTVNRYLRRAVRRGCVFRMMWIADSGRSGSAIPDEVDHRFRPKWIAFGRCGSPISGIVNARR